MLCRNLVMITLLLIQSPFSYGNGGSKDCKNSFDTLTSLKNLVSAVKKPKKRYGIVNSRMIEQAILSSLAVSLERETHPYLPPDLQARISLSEQSVEPEDADGVFLQEVANLYRLGTLTHTNGAEVFFYTLLGVHQSGAGHYSLSGLADFDRVYLAKAVLENSELLNLIGQETFGYYQATALGWLLRTDFESWAYDSNLSIGHSISTDLIQEISSIEEGYFDSFLQVMNLTTFHADPQNMYGLNSIKYRFKDRASRDVAYKRRYLDYVNRADARAVMYRNAVGALDAKRRTKEGEWINRMQMWASNPANPNHPGNKESRATASRAILSASTNRAVYGSLTADAKFQLWRLGIDTETVEVGQSRLTPR